jgi:hypothetical protein
MIDRYRPATLACVLLLSGKTVVASVGGALSLTPGQKAIAEAAAVKEPSRREEALRQAMRDGLLSGDRQSRDEVFRFLSENSRWIELRPFSDVIEEFAAAHPLHRGIRLLDDNELASSSLDVRKQLYREAIENGTARLRRGSPLTRATAIMLAAFEGMSDLSPLIGNYAPLVEDRWKRSLEFSTIPALLELTRDAADRAGAAEKAATRLATMDDESLRLRMESDEGFRAAVIRITEYVCARDPFSGRTAPGCQKIKDVVRRQAAVDRQRTMSLERPGAIRDYARQPEWLERWRERVE